MSIEQPGTQTPIPTGTFETDLRVYRDALNQVSSIMEPALTEARGRLETSPALAAVQGQVGTARANEILFKRFAVRVLPQGEHYSSSYSGGGDISTPSPFVAKVAVSRMLLSNWSSRGSFGRLISPYFVVGAQEQEDKTKLLLTTPWHVDPTEPPKGYQWLIEGTCSTDQYKDWQTYSDEKLINDLPETTLHNMVDYATGKYTPSRAGDSITKLAYYSRRASKKNLLMRGLKFYPEKKLSLTDLGTIDLAEYETARHLTGLAIDFGKADVLSGILKAREDAAQQSSP